MAVASYAYDALPADVRNELERRPGIVSPQLWSGPRTLCARLHRSSRGLLAALCSVVPLGPRQGAGLFRAPEPARDSPGTR